MTANSPSRHPGPLHIAAASPKGPDTMDRTPDRITVLIDGLALLKARASLEEEIGRRIDLDFHRLLYEARWKVFEHEGLNSERIVRAEFFAHGLFEPDDAYNRPSLRSSDFAVDDLSEPDDIYSGLRRLGYRIHGDLSYAAHATQESPVDEVVWLLRNDVGRHGGDLLYVGYESEQHPVREALLDIALQADETPSIVLGQFRVVDSQRCEDLGGFLAPKLDVMSDLDMSRGKILRLPEVRRRIEPAEAVPEHAVMDDRSAEPPTRAPRPVLALLNHTATESALWEICGKHRGPDTYPDWGRVRRFLEQRAAGAEVTALSFFANRPPAEVLNELTASGFQPQVLTPREKDRQPHRLAAQAINRALDGCRDRNLDIVLVTVDGDHAGRLRSLREADAGKAPSDQRRLTVIGLRGRMQSQAYRNAEIEVLDLEYDVEAFSQPLPGRRVPISLDKYEPDAVLGDFGLDDGPDAA